MSINQSKRKNRNCRAAMTTIYTNTSCSENIVACLVSEGLLHACISSSNRNSKNLLRFWSTPYICSFPMWMAWSIVSNAFLRSIKIIILRSIKITPFSSLISTLIYVKPSRQLTTKSFWENYPFMEHKTRP